MMIEEVLQAAAIPLVSGGRAIALHPIQKVIDDRNEAIRHKFDAAVILGLFKQRAKLFERLAFAGPEIVTDAIDRDVPNSTVSTKPRLRLASHCKSLQHFKSA